MYEKKVLNSYAQHKNAFIMIQEADKKEIVRQLNIRLLACCNLTYSAVHYSDMIFNAKQQNLNGRKMAKLSLIFKILLILPDLFLLNGTTYPFFFLHYH